MSSSVLNDLIEDKHELEMTPMIDVVFLLLIFFMCTLKFKTLDGKLSAYLPKDVGVNATDAEEIEKVEILVRIKEDGAKLKPGHPPRLFGPGDSGRYIWNTRKVVKDFPALKSYPVRSVEYKVGPFSTFDLSDLEDKLRRQYKDRQPGMPFVDGKQKQVPATIDARSGSTYEDVALVLDVALEAGFKEITFVGAFPDNIK